MPPPPDLAARPWRDRTHQPGPIFPQSPGSIFGRPDGFLASAANTLFQKLLFRDFCLLSNFYLEQV
jgi:hypothetical protein